MAYPLTTPREALLAFAENLDDWAKTIADGADPARLQAFEDIAANARDWADDQRCEVPILTPDAQTLAWTLAKGLEELECSAGAFRGSPDVARDVAGIRELFNGLVFGLTLGTLEVEQFYTLIGAPGQGGVTSTSAPLPGRAPIFSHTPGDAGGGAA